jgi:hypothetical protein
MVPPKDGFALTSISSGVLIFHSNFKPFVFSGLERDTNSNTFFGLCDKKAYKDCNILSTHTTKNNLIKMRITKLV